MRIVTPYPLVRSEPDIFCAPSTDPAGFMYSSYRAAPTETQIDKSSLNSSHQGVAYVSSSVGRSVSTLSFENTTPGNQLNPPTRRDGGIRDRVRGFSRASRRNLLRRLASINRSAFRAFRGRLIFVTLTYPDEYPEDAEVCKNHVKSLRKRLQREFKPFAAFWRMGTQRRGAWHFTWPSPRSSPRDWRPAGSGGMERGTPPCPVGDSPGQPQGRLQDQKGLQEAGEGKG